MGSQFTDKTGQSWLLDIPLGAVKRVKTLTGIDLAKPVPMGKPATNGRVVDDDDDEMPLLNQLETDPSMLMDVVYALVKPQADRMTPPVTDVEFGERITPQIFRAVSDAFWKEYEDFFMSLDREAYAKVIRVQRKILKRAMGRMATKVDGAAETAERELDRQLEQQFQAMTFGEPSTPAPES